MEVVEAVPYSAWEQAVFVVLVIVFAVALLAWFSKQSDKWQKFMFDIDDKWRAFNKEQREENNCAMTDVKDGLSNLTKVTEGLVMEVREMREESRNFSDAFREHDEQAKEILTQVKKPVRTKKPINKEQ